MEKMHSRLLGRQSSCKSSDDASGGQGPTPGPYWQNTIKIPFFEQTGYHTSSSFQSLLLRAHLEIFGIKIEKGLADRNVELPAMHDVARKMADKLDLYHHRTW